MIMIVQPAMEMVSIPKVERTERVVKLYIWKWSGVLQCLDNVALYGKDLILLPITSWTEGFKFLSQDRDVASWEQRCRSWSQMKSRKCSRGSKDSSQALRDCRELAARLWGLSSGRSLWNKAGPKERRKLVVEQIHGEEKVIGFRLLLGVTYDVLPST